MTRHIALILSALAAVLVSLACESWPAPAPDPMDRYRCRIQTDGLEGFRVCKCWQAARDSNASDWQRYDCDRSPAAPDGGR